MVKKQFKTESKRLLEMMINSIYTNKEIFLRELISNSSDAIDRIYYRALTDDNLVFNKDSYYIKIVADKENRTLTISDTGIGMTKEELEHNLGIIAQSGSLAFKQQKWTYSRKLWKTYQEKEFRSVSSGDLGIETTENENDADSADNDNKELFDYMRNILSGKIKEVRASKRLKTHPVCLSNEGEVTIEMEKILKLMPNSHGIKADKIFRLHREKSPVFGHSYPVWWKTNGRELAWQHIYGKKKWEVEVLLSILCYLGSMFKGLCKW